MDIKEKLREPFKPSDLEWRVQQCGEKDGKVWAMVLCYVNNRAIMDRLDSVFGISGWKNEYTKAPDGGIMCGLSVRIDNEWITKWDGAENTDIEAVKGGLSGAMKRAAVQFGVGRYLYNLDVSFANVSKSGKYRGVDKKKNLYFKYDPPELPIWALPSNNKTGTKKQEVKKVEITDKMKEHIKKLCIPSDIDDAIKAVKNEAKYTEQEKSAIVDALNNRLQEIREVK